MAKFQLGRCRVDWHLFLRKFSVFFNDVWGCLTLIVTGNDCWSVVVQTLHVIEFYRFIYHCRTKTTGFLRSILLIIMSIKFRPINSIRIFETRYINIDIFLGISVVAWFIMNNIGVIERSTVLAWKMITGRN